VNTVQKEKLIADANKISAIFAELSEENKNMIIIYASALRDKEVADAKNKEAKSATQE